MTTEAPLAEATASLVDTTSQTAEIHLDTEQLAAVELCMDITKRIVSVTGKAGTGKTTILKTTYANYIESGYSVALAALAGKAAKRINEVTGFPATTIHRLLAFSHPGEQDEVTGKYHTESVPKYNRQNPLPHDVIFIDEAAMVNQQLYRDVIDAMKPGAIVRWFGDINQLPPIEEQGANKLLPSPFDTLLKKFPSVTLKQLHRQGEGSDIAVNASRILYGMCPVKKPTFEIVTTNSPVDALQTIILDHPEVDWQSINNQIITPQNKSWIGTHALNGTLQPLFHESMVGAYALPRFKPFKGQKEIPCFIKVNDKVLWTKNDYNLFIFNGESGTVRGISDDGTIEIDFGDRSVAVPPIITYYKYGKEAAYDPRKVIELAYAVTTHKSQGSEYDHVVYMMNQSCYMMLNKSNFYTGVTRARKFVWIITDIRSMQTAVSTSKSRL